MSASCRSYSYACPSSTLLPINCGSAACVSSDTGTALPAVDCCDHARAPPSNAASTQTPGRARAHTLPRKPADDFMHASTREPQTSSIMDTLLRINSEGLVLWGSDSADPLHRIAKQPPEYPPHPFVRQ